MDVESKESFVIWAHHAHMYEYAPKRGCESLAELRCLCPFPLPPPPPRTEANDAASVDYDICTKGATKASPFVYLFLGQLTSVFFAVVAVRPAV